MKLNMKLVRNIMFGSLVVFLAVRLIFFLKDGSSDLVESILIWTIFFESILFVGVVIYIEKNSITDIFRRYKDKFYIAIMIFLLEIGFLIENQLGFNTVYIFSLLLIIILVSLVSLFLPRKLSKILDVVFILFYAFYLFLQDNYYRIFTDFFSFKEYGNFNEGLEFTDGMYEFSFLHGYIIVIALSTLILYIIHGKTSHLKFNKNILKKVFVLPLCMFLLVNINAQYPVKSARLHLSDHYLYVSSFSKERFVAKFSALNLLVNDSVLTLIPSFSTKNDLEFIENYYEDNIKLHTENEYSGIFEGKNLIFIVGESFDSIVVSEELTPNIYRLKTEGLDFQNHFTPVFPRTTCDTEVIFNVSIIPSIQAGPTCYVYNKNTYTHSLAELFNNKQYDTNAFHSNYKEFYTRDLVYKGFGYDNFYGMHELDLSESDKRFDSIFAERSMDYAINDDGLFFSFMLTLSGHSPYEITNLAVEEHYDMVDDFYDDTVPQSIKKYIASQIETDIMIGLLFDDLEEKGILEDTVIILTNDHYPYSLDQDEYKEYKNIQEDFMKSKSPMYIWASDIEHEEITKLTSSFDFLPTIINMFSLDGDYTYYVGNDVFSNDYKPIVFFKDFSIFDGTSHLELSSTQESSNSDLISIASEYYELSKLLLKVDYFKNEIH